MDMCDSVLLLTKNKASHTLLILLLLLLTKITGISWSCGGNEVFLAMIGRIGINIDPAQKDMTKTRQTNKFDSILSPKARMSRAYHLF